MRGPRPVIRKKAATNPSNGVPVRLRIERKKQFLIDVLSGRTVPDDFDNLRSLTLVRDWEDPGLGILKIGNTNSFTTTHESYGSIVLDIQSLVGLINKKFPKKKERRKGPPLHVVVNQEKDRAELAEHEQDAALEEWTQAQILVAELESKIRLLTDRLAYSEKLSAERAAEILKLRSEQSKGPLRLV